MRICDDFVVISFVTYILWFNKANSRTKNAQKVKIYECTRLEEYQDLGNSAT